MSLNEDDIRRQSGAVVTAADVSALDTELVDLVRATREPLLIDSHAVTKERFGFRVTAFSLPMLQALNPDFIFCLYTSAQTTVARISADPMGRPTVTEAEATFHTTLQAQLAIQYGVLLGRPVYLLDSERPTHELVGEITRRAAIETTATASG